MSLLAKRLLKAMANANRQIEFISIGTVVMTANNASFSIPAPSGIQDGYRIIFFMFHANAGITISSAPSGVSSVVVDGSGNNTLMVYEKIASGESGSYAFTLSSGANSHVGVAMLYRNVNSIIVGTVGKTSSSTATAPGITPANTGTLLQMFAIESNNASITTAPSGTQRLLSSTGTPTISAYDISNNPAGATGDKTLVWSTNSQNAGVLLQLMP